jgi:hypothetical protein
MNWDSCVLEGKRIGRVFAGCDFRSVIWQLCEKTVECWTEDSVDVF